MSHMELLTAVNSLQISYVFSYCPAAITVDYLQLQSSVEEGLSLSTGLLFFPAEVMGVRPREDKPVVKLYRPPRSCKPSS